MAYRHVVGPRTWVFADLTDADGEGDAAALRRPAGRASRPESAEESVGGAHGASPTCR